MADLNAIKEQLDQLTLLEASQLVKMLEEAWGVSAAAPVAMAAAMPGAAAEVAPVEEQTEFEVILLAWLASHYGRPETLFKRLMVRHGQLAKLYKFVMVTKNGTLRSQDFPSQAVAR